MPLLNEGKLRHRVDIDEPQYSQNTETGEQTKRWKSWATGVPAEVVPSSAREFTAAQATQSKIVGRIQMRYRPGLRADMRIRHRDAVYNIEGILPDDDSGLEYINIPVSAGVNDG